MPEVGGIGRGWSITRPGLAGLDPATFAGHSLRSGFLTSAAEAGASVFKLAKITQHRSLDTLRGYVRRVDLFKEHAGAAFLRAIIALRRSE